jgi:spermidine/putrescine transport system ATP-binding protein
VSAAEGPGTNAPEPRAADATAPSVTGAPEPPAAALEERAPNPSEPPATTASRTRAANAIELRGVSKRYRETVALQPVDLEIRDGEFFCLLGPSGCGKTTTLNLIGGFVQVSGGEIWIEGQRADRIPPYKRNVNTVFQNYALFPHLSVRDNVGFGLKMARVTKRDAGPRIQNALQLVGLEEHADRFPAQLSGGQQQRVAVARALVNRPAVLLLDEPLGALDLKLRKRLQIELAQIHQEVGTTFVFVTHDQEEAMAMADRIAVMNEGRIEQIGTPEEIYRRPASRFVADFIGESNFLEVERRSDGRVVARDGSLVACSPPPGEWRRATLMIRPEAIQVIAGNGHREGLAGKVVRSSFLGSFTRVAVQCDTAGAQIMAALQGGAASQLSENAIATVTWSPQDAVVLDPQ